MLKLAESHPEGLRALDSETGETWEVGGARSARLYSYPQSHLRRQATSLDPTAKRCKVLVGVLGVICIGVGQSS